MAATTPSGSMASCLMQQWELTRQEQLDPSTGRKEIIKLLADPLTVCIAAQLPVAAVYQSVHLTVDLVAAQRMAAYNEGGMDWFRHCISIDFHTHNFTVPVLRCKPCDRGNCALVAAVRIMLEHVTQMIRTTQVPKVLKAVDEAADICAVALKQE